jgi:hypothetical protein
LLFLLLVILVLSDTAKEDALGDALIGFRDFRARALRARSSQKRD